MKTRLQTRKDELQARKKAPTASELGGHSLFKPQAKTSNEEAELQRQNAISGEQQLKDSQLKLERSARVYDEKELEAAFGGISYKY